MDCRRWRACSLAPQDYCAVHRNCLVEWALSNHRRRVVWPSYWKTQARRCKTNLVCPIDTLNMHIHTIPKTMIVVCLHLTFWRGHTHISFAFFKLNVKISQRHGIRDRYMIVLGTGEISFYVIICSAWIKWDLLYAVKAFGQVLGGISSIVPMCTGNRVNELCPICTEYTLLSYHEINTV